MSLVILIAMFALIMLLFETTAGANLTLLHPSIVLRFSGWDDISPSYSKVFVGIGGFLAVAWVSGILDYVVVKTGLHRRNTLSRKDHSDKVQHWSFPR